MSKIEKFEDIVAWQRARELVNHVYKITTDGSFSRDFGLRDQIRRASISIMLISQRDLLERQTKNLVASCLSRMVL